VLQVDEMWSVSKEKRFPPRVNLADHIKMTPIVIKRFCNISHSPLSLLQKILWTYFGKCDPS
jgi:hypothetical protein